MDGSLLTSEDVLNTTMFSVYCIPHVCVKVPVIPHLLQGDLIIGGAPYIGEIDVLSSKNPHLAHPGVVGHNNDWCHNGSDPPENLICARSDMPAISILPQ